MRPDWGSAGFSRPDFVMLGITMREGGVMLVASNTLTQADIEQHMDHIDRKALDNGARAIDGPKKELHR